MLFNHKYSSSSTIDSRSDASKMNFVPDALREPTFFNGRLGKSLAFREAISALHHVVVSDLRFKPKDKTAYLEWVSTQEDILLAEYIAEQENRLGDVEGTITHLRKEISLLNQQESAVMKPFYDARRKYFDYLYKKDKDTWFVLDPVITVHPDQLFFECFSQDESSYGCLSCGYEVFDKIDEFACGTTNIDYSADLYNEFQKIRTYKSTDFNIDPSGFVVQTQGEEDFKEVKIDLPDSWVRGFLQVSSAMTLPMDKLELHPMDVYNICHFLRRHKAKTSPRSLRFILKPNQPIELLFEPWNHVIKCPRSIYFGTTEKEVRIWGRERLLILERLIPITKKFTFCLLGTGLPSFYIADLGDMAFTLGLSGWTANDWSRSGNFDLMAARTDVDDLSKQQIFDALKKDWQMDLGSLSKKVVKESGVVASALQSYAQAGRVIYDLNKEVYRVRELTQEPLPMKNLRFANEREEKAHRFLTANAVLVQAEVLQGGLLKLTGTVKDQSKTYTPELILDADQRMIQASCGCNFYIRNKLTQGPCEHILALRMAFAQRS